MSGVNKAVILGRLGADPELKYTPGGAAVCNFSVATSERYKDREGVQQERTEWHKIVTFGRTAEACGEHLKKGRQVYLDGRIQTRKWEKDGATHYMTEIVADTVQFLSDGKRDDAQPQAPQQRRPEPNGNQRAPQQTRRPVGHEFQPPTDDDLELPFQSKQTTKDGAK